MNWEDRVYFVRDPATGLTKIGHTSNLGLRVAALGRTHPGAELIADLAGDRRLEGRFHTLLAELHVGGEWFLPSPRLEAVVVAVREGWIDLSALPTGVSTLLRERALRAHDTRRRRLAGGVA